MPDKYDLAIEILTRNPEKIREAWNNPHTDDAGCLFMFAHYSSGCLTQIRRDPETYMGAISQSAEILADGRIPKYPAKITVDSLPVFAEWQRRLDAELGPDRNVFPK